VCKKNEKYVWNNTENEKEGVPREGMGVLQLANRAGENTIQLHVHFLSIEIIANTSAQWISIYYAQSREFVSVVDFCNLHTQ
jgi:hypothetical protein